MILDNAGYQLKAEMRAYAGEHRIKFYFTPTGASWLNRIECHFTAMKKFALDNTDHRSHEQQQAAVERYLTWRNGARDIGLCSWRSHCRHHRRIA